MRYEIKNLWDLGSKLAYLTEKEGKQPVKLLLADGERSNYITEMEIMEEPFVRHKTKPDLIGYPEELKRHLGSYDPEEYEVIEPKGTIFLTGNRHKRPRLKPADTEVEQPK